MTTTNRAEFPRGFAAAGLIRQSPGRQEPGRVVELLQLWQERRRYRSDLRRLMKTGTHLVTDIGLVPAHAEREVQKPFWQA